ncbi:MAG: hypothetical protein JSV36_20275 [Anaerolineae bacterium]|nr:MAG: hypothetical protein JSV36_20275 [Anaerolineae bacterium]
MSVDSYAQHHEMRLEKIHASGAEEWFCPTCGRRFLMNWPPAYKKIVLEAGDEYAMHSGGKGGLRMQPPQISEGDEEPVLSDELRAALEEILKDVDLDDWSGSADQ